MHKFINIFFTTLIITACTQNNIYDSQSETSTYIKIAKANRDNGSPEMALKFYEQAITLNPSDYDAYVGVTQCFIDMSKPDLAQSSLNKAKSIQNTHLVQYLQAKIHLLNNNESSAEKILLTLNDAQSKNALGVIYDCRGNHKLAQKYYIEAISLRPAYVDAYNNIGVSLMITQNHEEAIKYLQKASLFADAGIVQQNNLELALSKMQHSSKRISF